MVGDEKPVDAAEAEIRASHEEAAPLALIEASGDLRDPVIAGWSEGAAHLFGYTAEEVLGRSLLGTLSGRGGQEAFRRLAEDGSGAPHRCESARKDGSEIVVAWAQHPLRDGSGRPARAVYVGRYVGRCAGHHVEQDTSTRAPAGAEPGVAQQLLRAILDHLPIVVCKYDREGVITFQDGKGTEAIGVKPGQLLGANILELYSSDMEASWGMRRALAGEAARDVTDVQGASWETWYLPVRDARGEPDGAISITLNASEARQKEIELRAKLQLIEKQQKVIRDLSAPIIEVWDKVLTLPLVGVVDSLRLSEMMDNLLSAIVSKDARYAILDLTGVDAVDTETARHLLEMVAAIRLLGAEGIITGIRSNVAQTMIALGVDLSGVTTVGNLRAGLRLCMRRMAAAGEAGGAPVK
ncbi:anti-anti-sigma factor [Sorangium cellulosum]|uniref:Anti-anti-sigma factor n=2 Tax=Sorangium cellulosum TaxID=56 RepID=A0A2L0EMM5_SORCE|nr:anti-anti-sigma factor [Sorangium cellulosum]